MKHGMCKKSLFYYEFDFMHLSQFKLRRCKSICTHRILVRYYPILTEQDTETYRKVRKGASNKHINHFLTILPFFFL